MCTYLYAAFSLEAATEEGLTRAEADGGRALAPGDPRGRGRGDGPPHRGVEHHLRARRLAAFRARQFPARSRRAAGQRRREARAVQRGGAAALHLPRAARRLRTSPTARASRPSFNFTRGDVAPAPHADADRLRTVGDVLRDARRRPARVRRAARREGSVLRRSARCSSRAPRSTSRAAKPVICSKTALAAFDAIVEQGEGAPRRTDGLALPTLPRDPRGARGAARRRIPRSRPRFPPRVNPVLRRRCAPAGASGSRTRRRRPPSISRTPPTR